jgi:hypothetical protein
MGDLHYVPHGMANGPAVYLIAIDFASSITFGAGAARTSLVDLKTC